MSDATHVTAAKPKVGGAVFVAPVGSKLPTDATTGLDVAFKNLGYTSDKGLTNATKTDGSKTVKAWGGDVVLQVAGTKSETFKLELTEALNIEVLKTVYGQDNVDGTLSAGIHVKVGGQPGPAMSWVFETILKDDAVKRVVIPRACITELAEIKYNDSDPVGYGLTLSCESDDTEMYHHEYIKAKGT